jgi:hypothetical protein
MPSSSLEKSESTRVMNSFGRKTTMFISARDLSSSLPSVLGFGC